MDMTVVGTALINLRQMANPLFQDAIMHLERTKDGADLGRPSSRVISQMEEAYRLSGKRDIMLALQELGEDKPLMPAQPPTTLGADLMSRIEHLDQDMLENRHSLIVLGDRVEEVEQHQKDQDALMARLEAIETQQAAIIAALPKTA